MKYVKKGNRVFGYNSTQDALYENAISTGAVAISESDAKLIINPPRTPDQRVEAQKNLRAMAYRSESDSLFIEWQYDKTEGKELAWREKVKEIKARYPLE